MNREARIRGRLFDRRLAAAQLRYVRRYLPQLLLAGGLILVLLPCALALPYLVRLAIDECLARQGDAGDRLDSLYFFAGLYGILALAGFVGRFAQTYLLSWVGQRAVLDLRSDLFRKALSLPLSYYDRNPVGSLMTRVGSDMDAIQKAFTEGIVPLASDVLSFAGVLTFMFILSPHLAAACLLLLPVIAVVMTLVNISIRRAHRETRRTESLLNAFTQEQLSGMQTLQLFNRQAAACEAFGSRSADLLQAHRAGVLSMSWFFPSTEILGTLSILTILGYGAWLLHDGASGITIGVLVAFIMYMRDLLRPIEGFSERTGIFQSAFASAERVFHLLEIEDTTPEPERPVSPGPLRGEIVFEKVSFAYDEGDPVVKDISFHAEPGRSVALVGATGAGKTTLVHLLARLYEVRHGRILLDGHDLRDYRVEELRRRIGIITQDPFIFAGTVAQNIAMGRTDLGDDALERAASFVNAAAFIQALPQGMQTRLGAGGLELSTGQKQLVALARAFAQNPDILLVLDEATANVDTATEKMIQASLKKLMEDRTSILIAHRLSTIRHADLVLVMRHGTIVERGTHDELVARDGYYRDLYRYLSRAG